MVPVSPYLNCSPATCEVSPRLVRHNQEGLAILMALIALSMFSLLGLFMALNAVTEVRISDNYETQLQAGFAARAGLSHARELLRGLPFDYHLKGPDGANESSEGYVASARTFNFRNPLTWDQARSINIFNPAEELAGMTNDGIINTGIAPGQNGVALIPLTGIEQTAPNPYGSGTIITSRYFVKVSDNSGEASEVARDPADNPFIDGDGTIVIRSMGVAQTIFENKGAGLRKNSVVTYEARFRNRETFSLDAPLVLQGNSVLASEESMFTGVSFLIQGGAYNRGIGTIDVNTADSISPAQAVTSQLSIPQKNNVQGMGLVPSVQDITASISGDKSLLLDKNFLWNFVDVDVPFYADNVFNGNQSWGPATAPYLGSYTVGQAANDPVQDPKVTVVNGNLSVDGTLSGGGLLVVRGRLSGSGSLNFNGLVLIIGAGDIDFSSLTININGGLYVVSLTQSGGVLSWGTPRMTIGGTSSFTFDSDAVGMGTRLIPPAQLSWREVTSITDP